jgi:hypothetical protein
MPNSRKVLKSFDLSAFIAFGENPDGEGTILRLWEQAGIYGNCTVRLSGETKVTSVQPINLRGEKQGNPIKVKNGEFSFELKKYTPASFLLKF